MATEMPGGKFAKFKLKTAMVVALVFHGQPHLDDLVSAVVMYMISKYQFRLPNPQNPSATAVNIVMDTTRFTWQIAKQLFRGVRNRAGNLVHTLFLGFTPGVQPEGEAHWNPYDDHGKEELTSAAELAKRVDMDEGELDFRLEYWLTKQGMTDGREIVAAIRRWKDTIGYVTVKDNTATARLLGWSWLTKMEGRTQRFIVVGEGPDAKVVEAPTTPEQILHALWTTKTLLETYTLLDYSRMPIQQKYNKRVEQLCIDWFLDKAPIKDIWRPDHLPEHKYHFTGMIEYVEERYKQLVKDWKKDKRGREKPGRPETLLRHLNRLRSVFTTIKLGIGKDRIAWHETEKMVVNEWLFGRAIPRKYHLPVKLKAAREMTVQELVDSLEKAMAEDEKKYKPAFDSASHLPRRLKKEQKSRKTLIDQMGGDVGRAATMDERVVESMFSFYCSTWMLIAREGDGVPKWAQLEGDRKRGRRFYKGPARLYVYAAMKSFWDICKLGVYAMKEVHVSLKEAQRLEMEAKVWKMVVDGDALSEIAEAMEMKEDEVKPVFKAIKRALKKDANAKPPRAFVPLGDWSQASDGRPKIVVISDTRNPEVAKEARSTGCLLSLTLNKELESAHLGVNQHEMRDKHLDNLYACLAVVFRGLEYARQKIELPADWQEMVQPGKARDGVWYLHEAEGEVMDARFVNFMARSLHHRESPPTMLSEEEMRLATQIAHAMWEISRRRVFFFDGDEADYTLGDIIGDVWDSIREALNPVVGQKERVVKKTSLKALEAAQNSLGQLRFGELLEDPAEAA